jgi:benzodiazapine receptor
MIRSALVLVGFLAVCFAVAGLGGWATASSVQSWYPTLRKPSFSPPDWLFGPVWTALYTMMAVAAFLVWRQAGLNGGRLALGLFAVQLLVNLAWSPVFFGLRQILAGFIVIIVLWVAIAATTIAFSRHSVVAVMLMIPYLLWVTFAGVLNGALWWLNR